MNILNNLEPMLNRIEASTTSMVNNLEPMFSQIESTVKSTVGSAIETVESTFTGHYDTTLVQDQTWQRIISLNRIPTKPDKLKVEMLERNLEITGTSEQKSVENGFEIESVHKWTKMVQVPENVDADSVDVKLTNQNTLTITGTLIPAASA